MGKMGSIIKIYESKAATKWVIVMKDKSQNPTDKSQTDIYISSMKGMNSSDGSQQSRSIYCPL